MTIPQQPPLVEAHRSNADSIDAVQRWVYQTLGGPEWRRAANITVSIVRSYDGRWRGSVYGWAIPDDLAGRPEAQPVLRPGPDMPPWLDEQYVLSADEVRRAAQLVDRQQPGGDYQPTQIYGSDRLIDLGDIASAAYATYRPAGAGLPGTAPVPPTLHYVGEGTARMTAMPGAAPVPPEAMGSFFVPAALESAARGAAEQDAEQSRQRALDDDSAAAGPPLLLDLDTEAPKLSRRAKREAARAQQQQQPAVDPAPVVPASGHRPDANGVAPVEYPLCESRIWTAPRARRCTRQHTPGAVDLVHTADGYVWKDDDPRVMPDGVMHNPYPPNN